MALDIPHTDTAPYLVTGFFSAIFLIAFVAYRGEQNRDLQSYIQLSAFLMWIFYITVYTAQINPSFGPQLSRAQLDFMAFLDLKNDILKKIMDMKIGNLTDPKYLLENYKTLTSLITLAKMLGVDKFNELVGKQINLPGNLTAEHLVNMSTMDKPELLNFLHLHGVIELPFKYPKGITKGDLPPGFSEEKAIALGKQLPPNFDFDEEMKKAPPGYGKKDYLKMFMQVPMTFDYKRDITDKGISLTQYLMMVNGMGLKLRTGSDETYDKLT